MRRRLLSILSPIFFIAILFLSSPVHAQLGLGESANQRLISIVEPGQLADTVNVWGDVGLTGRYLVPRDITVVQLLSYAGGPGNIRQNYRNPSSLFSKTMVRVTISKYDQDTNREVSKRFSFKYYDKIPEEFRTYNLTNEEVITVEVEKRPTFLDYVSVIGPILGTLTTSYLFYDRVLN